jgi:hypothetical protein
MEWEGLGDWMEFVVGLILTVAGTGKGEKRRKIVRSVLEAEPTNVGLVG